MMNRLLLRLFVAYGMGVFLLAESFNQNFWRPNIVSLAPLVRLFVTLFGVAWFIQAVILHRQLSNQRG
jgi:hypothetical protein